jgi:hypothetical protein
MKTLLSCLIFSVAVSIFAYLCLDNRALVAQRVEYVNPVGVVLGFITALQGIIHAKKYVGLLGLTQLTFWPLYGFLLAAFPPPGLVLQIFLTTIITLYLGASLVFFGLAFYDLRWGAKQKDAEHS